jgi:hypothetical protein
MDAKKFVKIATTVALVVIPFGLTAVAGYYGYKKYKEIQEKKNLEKKKEE